MRDDDRTLQDEADVMAYGVIRHVMQKRVAKWDRRFLALAEHVATWSKDRSTKVGSVIVGPNREVLATGYNGFPRGIDDEPEERHERPAKYMWTEHAERNAIYNAARHGVRLDGATIYVPWFPCADCARAILQAGLAAIVCHTPDFNHERWGKQFEMVAVLLNEAGIEVRHVAEDSR